MTIVVSLPAFKDTYSRTNLLDFDDVVTTETSYVFDNLIPGALYYIK